MKLGRISAKAGPSKPSPPGGPRYWARVNEVEIPLRDGQALIGRTEDCSIVVHDTLVSRRHARILVDGDAIIVQDLGSSNGVFVNRDRIEDRMALTPGDSVFIGTTEIAIFENPDEEDRATESDFDFDGEDRLTPISAVSAVPAASSSSAPAPSSGSRRSSIPRDDDFEDDATSEVGAFEYLGRLADKMFTMGRPEAAQQILGGHLKAILVEARAKRAPDPTMVDAAGRYALKLAVATLDGAWVDLAIEMHLIGAQPMKEELVQQLASLRAKAPLGSNDLLQQYATLLRSRVAKLSEGERLLVERIACLEG